MATPRWLGSPEDGYPLYTLPVPELPGTLHLGPMPGRGHDERVALHLAAIHEAGVRAVLSLVPAEDLIYPLELPSYAAEVRARFGQGAWSLPVPDYGVPTDRRAFAEALTAVTEALESGDHVLVHCLAGCGRTGTFAAAFLVSRGQDPDEAIAAVRAARGCGPETAGQVAWVRRAKTGL